jgi:hypothetical protein
MPVPRLAHAAVLALLGTTAGCVPLLLTGWVAEPGQGPPVYSACTLDNSVPDAISVPVQGLHALVSLRQGSSRAFVEVRFDVPPGLTLVLDDDLIEVRTAAAGPARQVRFPNVSLVDGPIVNSYSTSSAIAPFQLPVRTPLVGGRTVIQGAAWDRHFWIAAPLAELPATDELWITLPGFTVNATPARIPALHYRQRRLLVAAPLNC